MSLYSDPQDDEEGGSIYSAMQNQAAPADDGSAASPYSPDVNQSWGGKPDADWLSTAPEAKGAAPFKTVPEGAAPRSTTQIGKPDVPKIGQSASEASQASGGALPRSPKWDELARLDKKIDKDTNPGVWGNIARTALALQSPGAYNALVTGHSASLQKQRTDLVQEAQYDDNRRGLQPSGKPVIVPDRYGGYNWVQTNRMGQQQIIGPAPDPNANAKIKAQEQAEYGKRRLAAMEKSYVDAQGQRWYTDPDTMQPTLYQTKGTPTQGSLLDADNPAAQSPYSPATTPVTPKFPVPGQDTGASHYETDDQGNVTELRPGAVPRKLGRLGKTKEPVPREDPTEKRASMAGEAAMQSHLRDTPGDMKGAQEAYAAGYQGAGGKKLELPGAAPPKGTKKNFRNKKTGDLEPFVSDGTKWVPARG